MLRHAFLLTAFVATLLLPAADAQHAKACTGIQIKPQDGSVIVARTLEFAADLKSNVIVMPRGLESVATAPGDKRGRCWKSQYAVLGANGFGLPAIVDGLNEKGLAAAIFYFPGYAQYQDVATADAANTVAPWELPVFLLANCRNVDEAVRAAHDIRVGNVFQKAMQQVPPCHYIIHDTQGRCAVLEYVAGQLRVHDNPLGVITNSPTFDWHLTNLCNYINLTVNSVPPVKIDGLAFRGLGQGTGMLGLPGDFTPPSRFVRAVAFSQSALPVATANEGVLQAFHLLNQFDIPKGAARSTIQGHRESDYTLWTSVSDLTNRRYYFRTFENSRIRMVDLNKMNLDAKKVTTIPMTGPEVIEDLSEKGL